MPHYIFESRALKTVAGPIAGVDEAGRGPLAGPVIAAAVILDRKRMPKGLNDSKQMREETRALDEEDRHYGWFTNKGYSTEAHLRALAAHGPCVHHRRSFAPVHNILYGENLGDSTINALIPQDS